MWLDFGVMTVRCKQLFMHHKQLCGQFIALAFTVQCSSIMIYLVLCIPYTWLITVYMLSFLRIRFLLHGRRFIFLWRERLYFCWQHDAQVTCQNHPSLACQGSDDAQKSVKVFRMSLPTFQKSKRVLPYRCQSWDPISSYTSKKT